jgi:hypothetical protein
MHVDRIPNRTSPPAFLLRETYREGGQVKKRTLANITHWPAAKIEALRRLLRDEVLTGKGQGLSLLRSLPHGHLAAALGMLGKVGLDGVLSQGGRQSAREVALCVAMMVATPDRSGVQAGDGTPARRRDANCSLGAILGLGAVVERVLYDARLADRTAGAHREGAGAPPPEQRHAGALRRHLFRGGQLPARQVRLQSRRQIRQAADRVRASVHHRGLPGRGRGVRRQMSAIRRRWRTRSPRSRSASGSNAWCSSAIAA